jgi:hypothetical protein
VTCAIIDVDLITELETLKYLGVGIGEDRISRRRYSRWSDTYDSTGMHAMGHIASGTDHGNQYE